MTNRRRRPGTRRDLPAGEVQKRGGVASSEVCERLNASNRHRWPGVSPHCLTPGRSTLGPGRSPANALLLTWMEVKGQESQGSGGPKLGRLRTRDHEGAPKGQEHVLPSPPALAPGPTLRPRDPPSLPSRGAVRVGPARDREERVAGRTRLVCGSGIWSAGARGLCAGRSRPTPPSDPPRRGRTRGAGRSVRSCTDAGSARPGSTGLGPELEWAGLQGQASRRSWATRLTRPCGEVRR